MTTSVTLTGTGVPHPRPGRAGPGALVRADDVVLQFDADAFGIALAATALVSLV